MKLTPQELIKVIDEPKGWLKLTPSNIRDLNDYVKELQKGKETLLADIRNKMTPVSNLICLVDDYFDGTKQAHEFETLHKHIKENLEPAKSSIEYLRNDNILTN